MRILGIALAIPYVPLILLLGCLLEIVEFLLGKPIERLGRAIRAYKEEEEEALRALAGGPLLSDDDADKSAYVRIRQLDKQAAILKQQRKYHRST